MEAEAASFKMDGGFDVIGVQKFNVSDRYAVYYVEWRVATEGAEATNANNRSRTGLAVSDHRYAGCPALKLLLHVTAWDGRQFFRGYRSIPPR